MAMSHFTNEEMNTIIDNILPKDRRVPGPSGEGYGWRVKYSNYIPLSFNGLVYTIREFWEDTKWRSNCVWTADTVKGYLLGHASIHGLPPYAVGAISAERIGWHDRETEGAPHRILFSINAAIQIDFIDVGYIENPKEERWRFKLTERDGRFFDLWL